MFAWIIWKYQGVSDFWSSPAAVVADSDAVQAGDGEDAQGKGNDDNVKHFELWVEEKNKHWDIILSFKLCGDSLVK